MCLITVLEWVTPERSMCVCVFEKENVDSSEECSAVPIGVFDN